MALGAVLIGFGQRGADWSGSLAEHPRWKLTGIVDPSEEARSSALRAVPDAVVRESLGEIDAPCDAVIVASPPEDHVSAARESLRRGYPLMVEKPFVTNVADGIELVRAAETAGVPLMVAQNYRYMRAHRSAKKVMDSGRLGTVHTVHASYHKVPHDMSPSLARSTDRVLWGMAIHHLDAVRYLLQQRATRLVARIPPALNGDILDVMVDFDGGTRLNYSASYRSSGHEFFEGGQEYYQRIVGNDATLHMFHRWLVLCERNRLPRFVPRGSRRETEEYLLLSEFADAIEGGRPVRCSGRDNLQTVAMMVACVESAQSGRWIDPQGLLDDDL
jgi:predicted dehydrogenase